MADYVGGDMIRGHIDTIILNSLIDGDKDSNQIRAEIEARAGGQFQLKQGTFYSALQRIVKQGYVIEYRTTGPDGVRRKYFQLTEKGKDLIDKNQSSWTMSRQVINTLLDTSQPTPSVTNSQTDSQEDEKIPQFDHEPVTFSELGTKDKPDEESVADQVVSSIEEIDEPEDEQITSEEDLPDDEIVVLSEVPPTFKPEDEQQTPQTFDDIMSILEDLERDTRQKEEESIRQEEERIKQERLLQEEKAKAEEEERMIAAQVEQGRLERERKLTEVEIPDEFQVAEERSKTTEFAQMEDPVPEVKIPEYIQDSLSEQEVIVEKPIEEPIEDEVVEEVEQITITEIPTSNEPDDYLNPTEIPTQKEYKDVLTRIFTSDVQNSNVVEFPADKQTPESVTVSTEQVVEEVDTDPVGYDRIVEDLDFSETIDQGKQKSTQTPLVETKKSHKNGTFDYSDIITMSEKEGFKVNTSDRTNKNELGKILINRLNFHTSIIFFILVAIETLVVGLTMDKVLNFGVEPYVYFALLIFIMPVLSGMIYYMAPKRTVAEVNTFKSSFETALIVTLNLLLMILVYVVIIDLDFSSQQELGRNLFIPILMIINVPLYIVIRYSLLEKQMYFS